MVDANLANCRLLQSTTAKSLLDSAYIWAYTRLAVSKQLKQDFRTAVIFSLAVTVLITLLKLRYKISMIKCKLNLSLGLRRLKVNSTTSSREGRELSPNHLLRTTKQRAYMMKTTVNLFKNSPKSSHLRCKFQNRLGRLLITERHCIRDLSELSKMTSQHAFKQNKTAMIC